MAETDLDIRYVAHLARLALTPEEEATLGEQLGQVLGYMEQLKRLDVSDVQPLAHALPRTNVLRPDEPRPSFSAAEALRNAPAQANDLFVVPKIVE